jgi:hypothetical protein
MATLGTLFAGTWAMSGGKKTQAQQGPPINASSKDEENFIQYVEFNQKEMDVHLAGDWCWIMANGWCVESF